MRKYFLLGMLAIILLTGCRDDKDDLRAGIIQSTGSLRIMHPNKDSFMKNFGYTFQLKYPGIQLDVVSSEELVRNGYKLEDLLRFVTGNRPDIIVVDPVMYQNKDVRRMLLPLEPFLQEDNIGLKNFVPSIIDFLNDSGKVPLYGLTPSFSSQALFWNRELFDRYGIPYPAQLMSWEDVLNTAKRFPSAKRVYGLYEWHPAEFDPFTLFVKIAGTYRMDLNSPHAAERLESDPTYRSIWDQVISAYREGYVYNPLQKTDSEEGPIGDEYKTNLFLQGKAAMHVNSNYFLKYLREAPQNNLSEIQWEIAAMPVNPRQPDTTHLYNIRDIYGIRSDSTNAKAAWTLLRHIHSDETARTLSEYDDSFGISTKLAYAIDFRGKELSAFFRLKPVFEQQEVREYDKVAVSSYRLKVRGIGLQALNGTLTSAEALEGIGQALDDLNR
ncbi:MAG: extracellular solute-binding protein [Paenibacillus sp.]|nr:extracellular solute-binding protein [Paenibacillus sp.]